MNRWVYTFAHDGTGTFSYDVFGNLMTGTIVETGEEVQFGSSLQITDTLEEARNTVWEWVSMLQDQEPQKFTWEFFDDSLELFWSEYDFKRTLHIEITEDGIMMFQQEPEISFIKE